MSNFPIIDLVIGLIFIFFLFSIICSSAVELCLTIFKSRASLLEKWLKHIFDSPALDSSGQQLLANNGEPISVGRAIMDHCMATVLSERGASTTYINTQNFVSALLDKITIKPAEKGSSSVQVPPKNLNEYIEAIEKSTVISGELKRTILMLAFESKNAAEKVYAIPGATTITNNVSIQIKSELEHFRERLESWYDKNAERLTGTFKSKKVVPLTVIVATIITVLFNADSLAISKYLYENKAVAKELSTHALSTIDSYKEKMQKEIRITDSAGNKDTLRERKLTEAYNNLKKDVDTLKNYAATVQIPLGWGSEQVSTDAILKHLIGWLATILAISLGAPFWFDILNKIANLRSGGPRPPTGNADK